MSLFKCPLFSNSSHSVHQALYCFCPSHWHSACVIYWKLLGSINAPKSSDPTPLIQIHSSLSLFPIQTQPFPFVNPSGSSIRLSTMFSAMQNATISDFWLPQTIQIHSYSCWPPIDHAAALNWGQHDMYDEDLDRIVGWAGIGWAIFWHTQAIWFCHQRDVAVQGTSAHLCEGTEK